MTASGPAAGTAAGNRLAQAGPSGVVPLSGVQQRLWLADQAEPAPSAYHLTRVIELDGQLDVAALGAALSDLAARHEALRTSMLVIGGQPLQRVAAPAPVALPVTDTTQAGAGELALAAARRPLAQPGGPMWRAELHRLHARRHRLVLVWHHLIADGATIALLLSELAAAYRARRDGGQAGLPPATAYREYIRHERSLADDPDWARQLGYWQAQLAGCEPLSLPADVPRPAAGQRPAGRADVRIPAATADELRAVARAHGATLAQVVLAGYAVALHRFGGQADFAVRTTVSLRRDQRWACSAGLYVAWLPIRVSLAGNPPFTGLLRQVRGTVLGALGAADVPPEGAAGPDGRPRDASFGLTAPEPALELPGLVTRVDRVFCERAKFDLHLEIADPGPGGGLGGVLEYDAGVLSPGTARHLADGIAAVLADAAGDPARRAGELRVWPEAPAPVPGGRAPAGARIDQLFAAAASARPGRVAVTDAAGGRELTYGELASRAAGVAAALAARGVRRGDFVGISLTRSADMIVAVLGVLAAGAAYVPLDPGYPAGQLTGRTSRIGVRLVLGDPLPGTDVPVISLAAAARAAPAAALAPAGGADSDPAYVMFTSGSTGQPKAVVVPHRAVVRLVRGADFAAMDDTQRWLHAAPPAFDAATLELWAPLLNGGTVVVMTGTPSVPALAEAIRRHGVTAAFLTTGLFNLVVDTDAEALRPLRQLVTGGEAASPGHLRRALEVVGTVVNGYGPTENTTFTACHRLHDPAQVASPVPLGTPVSGTTVHIADDYGHPVPAGVTGEILAGGLGLALGYAGSPGLTAERFVPSPHGPPGARLYRTGDYGRIDAGGLVQFAGRRDDQVKVRGFRVELGAVEQALLAHPEVAQAAVTVHTDPAGDRRLVGYVVGGAGPQVLSGYLADLLPPYMIPGQWIMLPELPLGPAGKVDRAALPAPGAAPARQSRPATVAEELLIGWYAELLGLTDVTPDTNFFSVGGHSLLASRLAARIRAALGVDLMLGTVFSHPRLADLAAAITAMRRADAGVPDLRPGGGTGAVPLSFSQERLWSRMRREPGGAGRHATVAIELDGDLDTEALAGAIQAVTARHPMLRAVFGEQDGRPWQEIRAPGPVTLDGPTEPTAAAPFRAALARTGGGRHRLLLGVHALAADDWSLAVICRDLAAAFRGELAPASELAYPDVAAWQRSALAGLSGPALGRLTEYWREQLADAPGPLELGGGVAAGDGGGSIPVSVPAGLAGRIRQVSRRARATPATVLLAVFALLLSREAKRQDLVIGVPLAGREDAALAEVVGPFASMLPLRIDASGEPEFPELIHRVRDTVMAGLAHAGLPAQGIAVQAQAGFGVQPALPGRLTLGEVTGEIPPVRRGTAGTGLAMWLHEDGEGFSGSLEYRDEAAGQDRAAGLAAGFTDLLASLTETA